MSKIFCVGCNKTGTTSLEAFFRQAGFSCGNQVSGEFLLKDVAAEKYEKLYKLVESADFFQDIPFPFPNLFKALDGQYPGSKFILTVRDNPEQWYSSFVRFHTALVGKGRLPSRKDLEDFEYRHKGWLLDVLCQCYAMDANEPYRRERLMGAYVRHNRNVIHYFRHRPRDLLIVNVAHSITPRRILEFLGREYRGERMLHLNRS